MAIDGVIRMEIEDSLRLRDEQNEAKWSEIFRGSNGVSSTTIIDGQWADRFSAAS
jgi:hypothetical protein